jgi:hypothetical protein
VNAVYHQQEEDPLPPTSIREVQYSKYYKLDYFLVFFENCVLCIVFSEMFYVLVLFFPMVFVLCFKISLFRLNPLGHTKHICINKCILCVFFYLSGDVFIV